MYLCALVRRGSHLLQAMKYVQRYDGSVHLVLVVVAGDCHPICVNSFYFSNQSPYLAQFATFINFEKQFLYKN